MMTSWPTVAATCAIFWRPRSDVWTGGCGRDCAITVKHSVLRQIRATSNRLLRHLCGAEKPANLAEVIPLIVTNPESHLARVRKCQIREYEPINRPAGKDAHRAGRR